MKRVCVENRSCDILALISFHKRCHPTRKTFSNAANEFGLILPERKRERKIAIGRNRVNKTQTPCMHNRNGENESRPANLIFMSGKYFADD